MKNNSSKPKKPACKNLSQRSREEKYKGFALKISKIVLSTKKNE